MVKETKMKQTEIGLIPEDWELFKIEEITPQNAKYTIVDGPFGSNLKTIHYKKKGIPIITSGYVTDGKFYAESYLYVDQEKFQQEKRSAVQGGDIVMAKIGERCGASAILPLDHPESILSGNALKIKIDEKRFNTELISQILYNDYLRGNLNGLRTVGAQPAISMANLKIFKIPLPPLAEQEAIATALSDCDSWIVSIEEVLAKKRLIKQGAMQELLTPRSTGSGTVVDGEPVEPWEVKKLGEVLQFGSGRDHKHLKSGSIPVYGTGGIMTYVNHHLYDGESVGIGRKRTIDKPVFLQGKFWTVDTLFFTHSFNGVIPKYIFYQFLLIAWKEYNEASGVPSLNKNTLEQIEIQLPSLSEQTRIAMILSDMDLEIEALEEKLGKARQIKQGMMQELLTGRVRLV